MVAFMCLEVAPKNNVTSEAEITPEAIKLESIHAAVKLGSQRLKLFAEDSKIAQSLLKPAPKKRSKAGAGNDEVEEDL